jgi:osmotically-inducible protein OsmY
MLRRLVAFTLLLLLVGAGLWLWRNGSFEGSQDLGAWRQRLGDARVSTSVEAALALNRRLAGQPLRVAARDGRVTLSGRVADAERRALAVELAGAVPGVTGVEDALALAAPEPAAPGDDRTLGERLDDQALEAKVRLAFALYRALEGARIEVAVRRRVVRLSGQVAGEAQRRRALQLAADVPDALRVEDALGSPAPPEKGAPENWNP